MLGTWPRRRIAKWMQLPALALVAHFCPGVASATNFSFSGFFTTDDQVALFTLTADGVSTVTARSYSYAGGTQANGSVVSAGGFDPIISVFDSAGNLLISQDDGPNPTPADPNTGYAWDVNVQGTLPAGTYTIALSQYNNFALGPVLSTGFSQTGNPNFTASLGGCTNGQFCDVSGAAPFNNRTNLWAFDILNVETAEVPEPGTFALVALGLAGISGTKRKS